MPPPGGSNPGPQASEACALSAELGGDVVGSPGPELRHAHLGDEAVVLEDRVALGQGLSVQRLLQGEVEVAHVGAGRVDEDDVQVDRVGDRQLRARLPDRVVQDLPVLLDNLDVHPPVRRVEDVQLQDRRVRPVVVPGDDPHGASPEKITGFRLFSENATLYRLHRSRADRA